MREVLGLSMVRKCRNINSKEGRMMTRAKVSFLTIILAVSYGCSGADGDNSNTAQDLTASECASYESEDACADAGCGGAPWVGISWKGTIVDGACQVKAASGEYCFLQTDDIGASQVMTSYTRVLDDGTREVWGVSADIGTVEGWERCSTAGLGHDCGCDAP